MIHVRRDGFFKTVQKYTVFNPLWSSLNTINTRLNYKAIEVRRFSLIKNILLTFHIINGIKSLYIRNYAYDFYAHIDIHVLYKSGMDRVIEKSHQHTFGHHTKNQTRNTNSRRTKSNNYSVIRNRKIFN